MKDLEELNKKYKIPNNEIAYYFMYKYYCRLKYEKHKKYPEYCNDQVKAKMKKQPKMIEGKPFYYPFSARY